MSKKNIAKEIFQQMERHHRERLDFHKTKFIHIFINLKSNYPTTSFMDFLDKHDKEVLRKAANRQLLFEHSVKSHFVNKYGSICEKPINYRPSHGQEHYKKQYGIEGLPF
jgi:hypothetical protein